MYQLEVTDPTKNTFYKIFIVSVKGNSFTSELTKCSFNCRKNIEKGKVSSGGYFNLRRTYGTHQFGLVGKGKFQTVRQDFKKNWKGDYNVYTKTIAWKTKKISGPSKTTVQTTQSTSPSDPLSTAFKGLPAKTRKDIQLVLKEKGLYTSTIDGLYGKGTRNAIIGFFKDTDLGGDLENMDLRKELSIIANLNVTKIKEEQERIEKIKNLPIKRNKIDCE